MDFDVILGGFVFFGFEIPSHISFGGEQLYAENIMIGGDRIIDSLGWKPGEIEWHGRFVGPAAEDRALELRAMAEDGSAVPLSWAGLFYMVLISRFHPVMEKPFEIPYEICLTVVNDPTQPSASPMATTDQLVSDDMNTAQARLGIGGVQGGQTGTSVSGGFGFGGPSP